MIQKVLCGSDHAFRLLIEKYRDNVFRTIFAVVRDQKEAEDATQEVWIKIYSSLPTYENHGFKTWITRIAVNYAIDAKRKKDRRQENVLEGLEQSELITMTDSIEHEIIKREIREKVHEKLHELPDNYRDVIHGYYIADKSYLEMAKEQNVQVKTIEMKLYRARLWIKKHWKEEDFS